MSDGVNFVKTTEEFLNYLGEQLTDQEKPLIATIKKLAWKIDLNATPQMLNQYMQVYKMLIKTTGMAEDFDPIEGLIPN